MYASEEELQLVDLRLSVGYIDVLVEYQALDVVIDESEFFFQQWKRI